MKTYPNWINNHTETNKIKSIENLNTINQKIEKIKQTKINKIKLPIEQSVYKRTYNSAIKNKNRKIFKEDTVEQLNLFNLANCFYNSGFDCIKQRFINFVPLQTTIIPCCVNLTIFSKLIIQYILSKFNISKPNNDKSLGDLFVELPISIKEYLQTQSHMPPEIFLEIMEESDINTYISNIEIAHKHINFFIKFATSLKSLAYSINGNVYFL